MHLLAAKDANKGLEFLSVVTQMTAHQRLNDGDPRLLCLPKRSACSWTLVTTERSNEVRPDFIYMTVI